MAMSLARLAEPTVRRSIEWDGEQVEFLFKPGAHTVSFEARLRAAHSDGEPQTFADLLAELITWIDVTDETGAHVPCTGTTFAGFPVAFLGALWQAAAKAMNPGEAQGGTSAAG